MPAPDDESCEPLETSHSHLVVTHVKQMLYSWLHQSCSLRKALIRLQKLNLESLNLDRPVTLTGQKLVAGRGSGESILYDRSNQYPAEVEGLERSTFKGMIQI